MRIAFGGIHTECSTYSHLVQTAEDFALSEGAQLAARLGLQAQEGIDLIPLFHARSIPGGPVSAPAYAAFKHRFLQLLSDALPVDGIFLPMHGAMHVEGMEDAEGDWIGAVRDLAGPIIPIAVSYDLHGNVTQKIVDAIDIFAAYRTAPHIDVDETHNRALSLLVEMLTTRNRRMVGWVPIPVLLSGERTSTEDEPAGALYRRLPEHDARGGICDANILVGYVWADTPRATASAVVTGTDADAIATSAEGIAQGYWEARAEFDFGVRAAGLGDCLDRADSSTTRPVILADSGDNPTGGGVGDRADVLDEVIARGMSGVLFAGIADAPAAAAAETAGVGKTISLRIGDSLGSDGPSVEATGEVLKLAGSSKSCDLQCVVRIAGNKVVITQRRRPFHTLADFARLGLDPSAARILVVKSGYLSPDLAPLANPPLMALTDGAVNQDIAALSNTARRHPTYPFQDGFRWRPRARLSKRARGKDET